MRYEFMRQGAERKALAGAIAEITGDRAVYQFVPSCAYVISGFTVTREGALETGEVEPQEVEKVMTGLKARGYEPVGGYVVVETAVADDECSAETIAVSEDTAADEPAAEAVLDCADDRRLTITMPLASVNVDNLRNLLAAKGELTKKALGLVDLPLVVEAERVSFPWFTADLDADTNKAYMHFIAKLCELTLTQKRIAATAKPVTNEKYSFRCFLLRLGFIGAEYKLERKILLSKLSGSSAFRDGQLSAKGEYEDVSQ